MQKPVKRTGLSAVVRKAIRESKGEEEHKFTIPAASNYLLEKMRLPEEKLRKARLLEAHSLCLLEATTMVEHGQPILIKTVRRIIEETARGIPSFIQRNKVGGAQRKQLELLMANLQKDLQRIRKVPDNMPTTLSPGFLNDARIIQQSELEEVLGPKFRQYMKTMQGVLRILGKRSQNFKWQ